VPSPAASGRIFQTPFGVRVQANKVLYLIEIIKKTSQRCGNAMLVKDQSKLPFVASRPNSLDWNEKIAVGNLPAIIKVQQIVKAARLI
jgi:hypothetical protein